MKTDVIKLDAKKAGSIELSDAIFGLEPRADILHRMVRYQLAKRQAGTHKVKTRSETSYSTKKIYRQKRYWWRSSRFPKCADLSWWWCLQRSNSA